ncbi:MAG: autotransporter outer membrane beta-barrel domain-containing protein [Zoogloeaceae bacterium]|nr:autotransporter outer membrane beta-barrel domain-containing protein [Zoogloeaceae bacterium]
MKGSDTVRLSSGESVKFAAVDSHRTRLGARWGHAISQNGKAYLGAAWEHEYDERSMCCFYPVCGLFRGSECNFS